MEILATSRLSGNTLIFDNNSRMSNHQKQLSYDRVSISNEAKLLYQNSIRDSNIHSPNEDKNQIQSRLNRWFNNNHSGSNLPMKDGDKTCKGGTILPENMIIKEDIEKQIDKIIKDANYSPPSVASQDLIEKLLPLQQKLNAISALGDSMIMTEDVLEQASSYLQGLENEWSRDKVVQEDDTQLQTILNKLGRLQIESINDEEKIKRMKDDILEELMNNV